MDGGGAVDGGGGVPSHPGGGDAVMTEAQPESQNSMMPMSATATTAENISATLSHGGRFIQYNIFGNIFEVTAKYKPPILPIGKGAYGIVWSLFLSLCWISSISFFLFFWIGEFLVQLGLEFGDEWARGVEEDCECVR